MLTIVTMKWNAQVTGESIPSQSIINYGRDHVTKHYNMCKRWMDTEFNYVFYTDEFIDGLPEGIDQRPLFPTFSNHFERGGCYHRLFMFSKEFYEMHAPFVSMDLDMVITGDITSLFDTDQPFVYYKMKGGDGNGWRMNNGMFYINTDMFDPLWKAFDERPEMVISNRKGAGTDQGVTNGMIGNFEELACWQQGEFGPGIWDLRQDFDEKNRTDLPHKCKIVMCPGPRDPSLKNYADKYPWLKQYYEDML